MTVKRPRIIKKSLTKFRTYSSHQKVFIFVVGFALVGVITIILAHAAGFFASVQPEGGTVNGPATVVTGDNSASGNSYVVFRSGSTPGCTPLSDIPAGYPNNCTTGYKAAPDYPGSLKQMGSASCPYPITSNTTYNFCDFPGGIAVGRHTDDESGTISNVTFHGCRFHSSDSSDGSFLVVMYGDNITFDYSSFEPDVPFVHDQRAPHNQGYGYAIEAGGGYYSFARKLTMTHSDIWGFADATDIQGSTQAKPQVYRDNWIHDARDDGGSTGNPDHTDGLGTEGLNRSGSFMVIDHNTIIASANTQGLAYQDGDYSDVTISNNAFGGFGYTVNLSVDLGQQAARTTFINNIFDTRIQQLFGPVYPNAFWVSPGSYWHNNRFHYNGATLLAGNNPNSHRFTPADNNMFWVPSGISSTDYQ